MGLGMKVRRWRLALAALPVLTVAPLALHATAAPGLPPEYVGAPATKKPLTGGWLPNVPNMSSFGAATMHGDGYASDTHPFSGTLGRNPQVTFSPKGPCAGLAITRDNMLVLQCGGVLGFTMRLVDPTTLQDVATYNLPPRPSTIRAVKAADIDKIYSDSSGAYFFLDDKDRAVVADAAKHIQRVAIVRGENGWRWQQVDDWDLSGLLPNECETFTNPTPNGDNCDAVTSVQPDRNGLLWWVSRQGRVGTINPRTDKIRLIHLRGEQIQNSFAVDETGAVSIVSDHALYSFRAGADGVPRVVWREVYDRGTFRKVGMINQGSGTTPTYLGRDWVAIADNADGRIRVNVYRKADRVAGRRLVCSVPVFGAGQSATENSLIGYDRSLMVENNFGYLTPGTLVGGKTVVGGLTKIDVTPTGCRIAWTSKERSPSTVPKLSRGNGLVYVYTKEADPTAIDAWYLTAIDWRTGKTVFKVHTGNGIPYDNAWAPITIGPDVTYVSTFGGLLAVRDGA